MVDTIEEIVDEAMVVDFMVDAVNVSDVVVEDVAVAGVSVVEIDVVDVLRLTSCVVVVCVTLLVHPLLGHTLNLPGKNSLFRPTSEAQTLSFPNGAQELYSTPSMINGKRHLAQTRINPLKYK